MEEKQYINQYRYLMLGGSLLLIIVGLALLLVVSFAIGEPVQLGYTAVYDILGIGIVALFQIIQIIGIIFLIPGISLLICGILVNKLSDIDSDKPSEERKTSLGIKIIRIIIIISAVFLFIVIPIGTCIGMNLIRERWMLKE